MEDTLKTLGIEDGYYLSVVTGDNKGCGSQVSSNTMWKLFTFYDVSQNSIFKILETRQIYFSKVEKKFGGKSEEKMAPSKSESKYPVTIRNRTGKDKGCCFICDKTDGMQMEIKGDDAFSCAKPDKRKKLNNLLSAAEYLESRKQDLAWSKPGEKPCSVCNKLAR